MPKKKRSYPWFIFIILLIGAGGYYFYYSQQKKKKDSQSDVRVATVKRRDISTKVLATGIIKPKVGAEVKVGSRVSGIVKKLHVNIGDKVSKGQLLAEIDPTEFEAQYNQAQAGLKTAEANLNNAEASLQNAEANFNFAKVTKERVEQLLAQDVAAQAEFDQAEAQFLQAKAQIEQQKAVVEQQKAQIEQQKANLDFVRIQLGYTRLYAPISGVVASVSTQEGETVAASFAAPTFVTILDLDRLEIWTYIDETDIGRIEPGQQATFTVDTYIETDFTGEVKTIYPQAELKDNVVNYLAIVEIGDKKDKILRPEMTATVNIHLEKRENVLVVPNRAVMKEDGERIVQVVKGEGVERRVVRIGAKDKYYTEIVNGLSDDERIVTNPR